MNKEYITKYSNGVIEISKKVLNEEPSFEKSNELVTRENIVENKLNELEGLLKGLDKELEDKNLDKFLQIKGHYFPSNILIFAPMKSISSYIILRLLSNSPLVYVFSGIPILIYTILEIKEYKAYRETKKRREEILEEIFVSSKSLSDQLEILLSLREIKALNTEEHLNNKSIETSYDEYTETSYVKDKETSYVKDKETSYAKDIETSYDEEIQNNYDKYIENKTSNLEETKINNREHIKKLVLKKK